MTTIIHTADWHLGASLDSVSLLEDQRRFLDWLLEVIQEEVDVLLVSGDIFDRRNPSAEALTLYYRFLARLSALDPAPVAIITAGNHDSPSRLDAPSEILDALRIRVVGGVGPQEAWAEQLLIPIPDAERPRVVVAAVPYVHEYTLGVNPVGLASIELKQAMYKAFAGLYQSLAKEAARRWPDAPRIAMGHLTVGGDQVDRDDFPNEIHQVGTIQALPPTLFGKGWDYVALGHIHRPMPVGSDLCRYSGTPVAISFGEGSPERQLRVLELPEGGGLRHRALPVPRNRMLVKLEGTEQEVLDRLSETVFRGEPEPLLRLEVTVPRWDPTLDQRARQAVSDLGDPKPRLLSVVQRTARATEDPAGSGGDVPALETLQPDEVFRRLVTARRGGAAPEDADALMVAFRHILSARPEEEPHGFGGRQEGQVEDREVLR